MKMAMVFTFGTSLETWYKQGILEREKLIYEEFIRQGKFAKIYWFTYGVNDKKLGHLVNENIEIIPLSRFFDNKIGMFIYSFLMPFLRGKYFKQTDIIKTNQMKGSWTAWLAALVYKKKFVLRGGYIWSVFIAKERAGLYSQVVDFVEGVMCKLAQVIIVSSNFQKRYIIKKYNLREEKIFSIGNYVDTDLFKPGNNLVKKNNRMVFVGRLHKQKNLTNLIIAMKGLNLELDIYGDGELKGQIVSLAKENSVDVRFNGFIPNAQLSDVLRGHRYFILPSLYEGMPKSLLEAMACGLVVIGTDVDGINEVVCSGENGLLAEDISVDKIREVLSSLGKDKKDEDRMAVNARNYIEKHFSLRSITRQELSIYQRL